MKPITSLKAIAQKRSDIFHIDPRKIEIMEGHNLRTVFDGLPELKESIKSDGMKRAVICRIVDGKLFLVHGERRMRAVRELLAEGHKVPMIPVVSENRGTDPVQRLYDLFTDNDGLPFTLLEKAEGFRRLVEEHNQSPADVAKRRGCSKTHVLDCLALLKAPADVLALIRKKKISESLVIELMKQEKDPEALSGLVKEAVENATASGKDHASRKHLPPTAPTITPSDETMTPEEPGDGKNNPPESTGKIVLDIEKLLSKILSFEEETIKISSKNEHGVYTDTQEFAIEWPKSYGLTTAIHLALDENLNFRTSHTITVKNDGGTSSSPGENDPEFSEILPAFLNATQGLMYSLNGFNKLETHLPSIRDSLEALTTAIQRKIDLREAEKNAPPKGTDWSKIDGNAGAGGGPGSEKTSFDTSKNLEKLEKALEKLEQADCDQVKLETTEFLIAYLTGHRDTKELKKFLTTRSI